MHTFQYVKCWQLQTDREDRLLAISRLEKQNPRITLEEMEKRLDLEG